MTNLLKTVISLSLSGSLIGIIILFAKPFIKNKISKQWQYYIWLIVILRLLIPIAPESNFMNSLFRYSDFDVSSNNKLNYISENQIDDFNNVSTQYSDEDYKYTPIKNFDILRSIFDNLNFIWICIALIFIARKITVYQSFVKYIKSGCIEVSDIEILNRFNLIKEKIKLKGVIEFYTNPIASSPMILGVFHPCVILPNLNLSESEFYYTILHELTHYKRLDLAYKWLVQLTICLHWFNPIIYLIGKEINQACELSCDEAIIYKLDVSGKQEYGNTLLNAMNTGITYHDSIPTMFTESTQLLKERLEAIMKFKSKSKLGFIFTIAFTFVICLGSSITGAYTLPTTDNMNILLNNSPKSSTEMQTLTLGSKLFYLVDNEQQLKSIGSGKYTLDQNYMLNNDILLTEEWSAIGDFDNPFSGTFNGNGFEIQNLKNTDPNAVFAGLFGYANGAKIYNITLRNIDISKAGGKGKHVAPFVAIAENSEVFDNRLISDTKSDKNNLAKLQFSSLKMGVKSKLTPPFRLQAGKIYTVNAGWDEEEPDSINMKLVNKKGDILQNYTIQNKIPLVVTISKDDECSFIFENLNTKTITNLVATINPPTDLNLKLEPHTYLINKTQTININEKEHGSFPDCKFVFPNNTYCDVQLEWDNNGILYFSNENKNLDWGIIKGQCSFELESGTYEFPVRTKAWKDNEYPKNISGTITFTVK